MPQLQQLQLEKIRRQAKADFYYFCKHVLSYDLMADHPHQELCDTLTSETKKKLILLPRGSFKSTVATVSFTLWNLVKNPNIRVLISSENFSNSAKYLQEIKNHIEQNKLFIALFGNLKPNNIGFWRKEDITVATRTNVGSKEPSITASGVGQTKVGMHYDLVILDDIVSNNNINTAEQIEKTLDYYRLILSLPDPGATLIVIGTRYHFNDLYGHILEEEKDYYDIIIRKAIRKDKSLYFPTRLTQEFLDEQKRSQGSSHFCTPAETPILMGDFTIKPISKIKVGDKIIGYNLGKKGKRAKLNKTIVEKVFTYEDAQVYDVLMESGNTVRCTKEHQWYSGRGLGDKTHKPYYTTAVNRKLTRSLDVFYKPTKQDLLDWQYLAGMLDGEGSCGHKYITIHQSEKANPEVCRRIEEILGRLRINYKKYCYGEGHNQYWLNGGRTLKHRIIQYGNPAKKFQILRNMYNSILPDCGGISCKERIVNMTLGKKERVYALQTTSGNYIAWGYASSNSNQYQNEPIDAETAIFRQQWIQTFVTPPDNLRHFILTDAAASLKQSADYSVVMVVGVDEHCNIFVLDPWRDRVTINDFINKIFESVQLYNVHMEGVVTIEVNAFQQAIKYMMTDEMEKRKFYFPIKELMPNTTVSKDRRIKALQPYFENGKIFYKKEHTDLIDETLRYPKTRHDDMIDALCAIVQVIFPADAIEIDPFANSGLTENEQKVWKEMQKSRRVKRKKYY